MKAILPVEAVCCVAVIGCFAMVGCSQTSDDIKSDPPVIEAAQPGIPRPDQQGQVGGVEPIAKSNRGANAVEKGGAEENSAETGAEEEGVVVDGWMCPKDTSGPKLVLIPVSEGASYCIDANVATYGDFHGFVKKHGDDLSLLPPECAWKKTFGPVSVYEVPGLPGVFAKCGPSLAEADPDLALDCVDFCDAWAFCAASGKRMCGLRGADSATVSAISVGGVYESGLYADGKAASIESEWFGVCSQGGTTKYPYGNDLKDGTCIDKTKLAADGDTAYEVGDTTGSQCKGSKSPYNQVYNMSGGRTQWLNICTYGCCYVQGGLLGSDPLLSCAESMGCMAMAQFTSGVRCCADAVPSGVGE